MTPATKPLGWNPVRSWPRWSLYVFAATITLAMLLVRMQLAPSFGERPLLILLMLPIVLSSLLGGLGPGLLATGIAASASAWFIPPATLLGIDAGHDQFQWSILIINGVLVSLLAGWLHRTRGQVEADRQVQAEQLRALRLLDAIAEESADCLFAKDSEDRFTLFNRALERLSGKKASEVLGRDESAIFPAELAAQIKADNRLVMAENRSLSFQENLVTAQGTFAYMTTKSPLHDADGKVVGLFGIARDITDLKQVELALRESEGRFRALVEETLAGIYIIQDDHFRYVNPGFAAIFGYDTPEALIDRVPVADLVSPEHRERVAENLCRRLEGEIVDAQYTFTGLRRNGERVDVEVHGRVFVYQGEPAVIGLLMDISERKQAEQALAESEEIFRAIFEQAGVGVALIDSNTGAFLRVNSRYGEIVGLGTEAMKSTDFMAITHPDDLRTDLDYMARLRAGEIRAFNLDKRYFRHDGVTVWVNLAVTPLWPPGAPPNRHVAVVQDISERKAAEEMLQLQAEELKARNAELERFNRAVVGRELDMIELKRQVNELSRELGREPPHALSFPDSPGAPDEKGAP
ncbi:MAG: PAS domain S-box protein [Pseudomonadota bacterium]|nr:PAS domain S-box protein [Pseudomonadota bacterium]MDP1904089.1 PAS domain S-box protein [Pseudomonadota bacterium]MDP2354204.1 PAS domain S-box protein [Pseudomonadota bacterium]